MEKHIIIVLTLVACSFLATSAFAQTDTNTVSISPPDSNKEQAEPLTVPATFPLYQSPSPNRITHRTPLFITVSVVSATEILSQQPGVVNFDGRLHVRGGLADEVAYFIDGIPATNPYSGKLAITVPPSALENAVLLSGGLPARYGGNMSGVVELTTIRPGRRIGAEIKWTGDLLTGSRHDNLWDISMSGLLPYVPKATFGVTAQVHNGDDVRPCFMPEKYFIHDASKDVRGYWADTCRMTISTWDSIAHRYTGGWMDSSDAVWEARKEQRMDYYTLRGWKEWDKPYLPNSGFNNYYFNGSLGYNLPARYGSLKLTGMTSREQYGEYNAQWKYNLDGYTAVLDRSSLLSASWQVQPWPFLQGSLRYSRISARHRRGIRDTTAERTHKWWQDYSFIGENEFNSYTDPLSVPAWLMPDNPYGFSSTSWMPFYESGLFPDYDNVRSTDDGWLSEVGVTLHGHHVTAGADFHATSTSRNAYNSGWSSLYSLADFELHGRTYAFYLQDSWVYGNWSVAPGFRFEYGSLSGKMGQRWPALQLSSLDTAGVFPAATATAISPRVSVAYRLSERTSFQAGYEKLNSLPTIENASSWLLSSWQQRLPLDADSFFVFQKTDQYQASFSQRLPYEIDATATLFERVIDPVIQLQFVSDTITGLYSYIYRPQQYGRSKGLEFTAYRRRLPLTVYFGYTWNASTSTSGSENYPMPYDLRHKFTQFVEYATPNNFGINIGGIHPLADIAVRLTNNVASGFLYSRISSRGYLVGKYLSQHLPRLWTTDLTIFKDITCHSMAFTMGVEITNLFNRKKLAGVYPTTGLEDNDGNLQSINEAIPGNDSIPKYYSCTITDGPDSGHVFYIPNEYYNPSADLNNSGAIDRNERYTAYVRAWSDQMTDPFNTARYPSDRSYLQPRLIKLSFGIKF